MFKNAGTFLFSRQNLQKLSSYEYVLPTNKNTVLLLPLYWLPESEHLVEHVFVVCQKRRPKLREHNYISRKQCSWYSSKTIIIFTGYCQPYESENRCFAAPNKFAVLCVKNIIVWLKGYAFKHRNFPRFGYLKIVRFGILRSPLSYSSFIYSFVVYFGPPQFCNPKGNTVFTNFPHFCLKSSKGSKFLFVYLIYILYFEP